MRAIDQRRDAAVRMLLLVATGELLAKMTLRGRRRLAGVFGPPTLVGTALTRQTCCGFR